MKENKKIEQFSEEATEIDYKQAMEVSREIEEILNRPTTKINGLFFRNWLALGAIGDVSGSAFCPICGRPAETHLRFICHDLSILDAKEKNRKITTGEPHHTSCKNIEEDPSRVEWLIFNNGEIDWEASAKNLYSIVGKEWKEAQE